MIIAVFSVLFISLLISIPIAVSLGMASIVGLYSLSPELLVLAPQKFLTGINSFTLLAIPMFILAGTIMGSGGIAARIVNFCLIFVGALLVRGIETVWKESAHMENRLPQYNSFEEKNLLFKKGEELGCFKYGSTVILLFVPKFQWLKNLTSGTALRMGERIALRTE